MLELLLIRHGETDYNRDKRYLGYSDIPLNETGIAQAGRLREIMRSEQIDRVVSSDLRRCMQTARIALPDHPLQRCAGLREINFGAFEGLTFAEIADRYPDESVRLVADMADFIFPGGESFLGIRDRVITEIESYRNGPEKKIALFTHTGPIHAILAQYIIGRNDHGFRFVIENGSIARICFSGNHSFLKTLNER